MVYHIFRHGHRIYHQAFIQTYTQIVFLLVSQFAVEYVSRKSIDRDHARITSRAWGTLSLGVLLALILGLIARIPQSDIVLIAAIRCIGICSSTRAAGLLLLGVLLITVRLLILLLGLREV